MKIIYFSLTLGRQENEIKGKEPKKGEILKEICKEEVKKGGDWRLIIRTDAICCKSYTCKLSVPPVSCRIWNIRLEN
jgi:hypothetical protein